MSAGERETVQAPGDLPAGVAVECYSLGRLAGERDAWRRGYAAALSGAIGLDEHADQALALLAPQPPGPCAPRCTRLRVVRGGAA